MVGLVRRDEVQHRRMNLTALIYKLCLRGTYGIKVKSLSLETLCLTLPLTSCLTLDKYFNFLPPNFLICVIGLIIICINTREVLGSSFYCIKTDILWERIFCTYINKVCFSGSNGQGRLKRCDCGHVNSGSHCSNPVFPLNFHDPL